MLLAATVFFFFCIAPGKAQGKGLLERVPTVPLYSRWQRRLFTCVYDSVYDTSSEGAVLDWWVRIAYIRNIKLADQYWWGVYQGSWGWVGWRCQDCSENIGQVCAEQSWGRGKTHREVHLPQLTSSTIRVHVCVAVWHMHKYAAGCSCVTCTSMQQGANAD